MSGIRVRRTSLSEIGFLRDRYRSEADCQIVRDSILPRGLAYPVLLEVDDETAGYAAIWTEHFPNRITEFFPLASYREIAPRLVRAIAESVGATELEVQTNILDGRTLLEACTTRMWVENLLFEAGPETRMDRPDLRFRPRREPDEGPRGEWVVEGRSRVLGAGGWLTHYNAPYADLYMEVAEGARRRGVGSFLVQELRRACEREGFRAAARCDPENRASRRTLERGGLVLRGQILAGTLDVPGTGRDAIAYG